MDWIELAVALLVILAGSELFTNGVEWVGEGFGLSEGAVGSVLAAIGTALPETVLPLIAILFGSAVAGSSVGVGAILGAPLMLSTLALALSGASGLAFAGRRGGDSTLRPRPDVVGMDLSFFLPMYAAAVIAGLAHLEVLRWVVAGLLVITYGVYVVRHFRAPAEAQIETEAAGEVRPLRLRAWARRLLGRPREWPPQPPAWASAAQTLVGLALIIAGAKFFVDGIETISSQLRLPALLFALLVAPVATELPETFNSVLWIRRGKDTLAIGNVTGAMVFQASFPVSIGLLLTSWRLSQDGLVAALVALAAGGLVLTTLRVRGRLPAWSLVAQAILYAGYVIYALVGR